MTEITDELYRKFMLKYEFALNILETNIRILLKQYEYLNDYTLIDHIKTRLKAKESVVNKLKNKGYEPTFENLVEKIHDIVGLRIVCPFLSDVYTVVNMIKSSKLFEIVEEKDYIASPKDTGYISYHLIVLVPVPLQDGVEYIEAEIQVRTMAMDFWASLEHRLQYKFSKEIPEKIKHELYNCSVDIKEMDHKMLMLKELIKDYSEEN